MPNFKRLKLGAFCTSQIHGDQLFTTKKISDFSTPNIIGTYTLLSENIHRPDTMLKSITSADKLKFVVAQ